MSDKLIRWFLAAVDGTETPIGPERPITLELPLPVWSLRAPPPLIDPAFDGIESFTARAT